MIGEGMETVAVLAVLVLTTEEASSFIVVILAACAIGILGYVAMFRASEAMRDASNRPAPERFPARTAAAWVVALVVGGPTAAVLANAVDAPIAVVLMITGLVGIRCRDLVDLETSLSGPD